MEHDRRGAIRRRGKKRRGDGDRRQSPDRRAGASPFDPAKAEQIREVMARTGVPTVCPHCNQQLQLGPPIRAGGLQYREVHCLACRRSARIANLP